MGRVCKFDLVAQNNRVCYRKLKVLIAEFSID